MVWASKATMEFLMIYFYDFWLLDDFFRLYILKINYFLYCVRLSSFSPFCMQNNEHQLVTERSRSSGNTNSLFQKINFYKGISI